MIFDSFSLNGAWDMGYQPDPYLEEALPQNSKWTNVPDAVPGYWEDMGEEFRKCHFFSKLKINPDFGIQSYPIADTCPDMALPNIMGNFFYKRCFSWTETTRDVTISFDGVQNSVSVWVNGIFIKRHEGYCTPFEICIPKGILKNGLNEIVMSVSNIPLRGFQKRPVLGLTTRAANLYTGGITGNVELRVYRECALSAHVIISENTDFALVKVEKSDKDEFLWEVLEGDSVILQGHNTRDFEFSTSKLKKWSPESPSLYTLRLSCGDASFEEIFGVRRLTVSDGIHLKLNGIPYYLRGVCEHCYFPETIHPNHDALYYRSIVMNLKKLGFNFIRFHTYVPEEEYLRAADELGMLVHVESPNNTTIEQWQEIVHFARRHPSVVIYCCGNELLMKPDYIEFLSLCAQAVHEGTDALFSPQSAMRGVEYGLFLEPEAKSQHVSEPFEHNPERFKLLEGFCDMYSSYTNGYNSYFSLQADPERIDSWSDIYSKPRVIHEICIDGTYTDLSLKSRYRTLRVGQTDMFSSLEKHLEDKGVIHKAPLYFKNSCEWQRRVRKYCFEQTRRSRTLSGFDFLGPIDTHWHTFGYDVGMMNEFYELKPGETIDNVLSYNSPTVLLTDLSRKSNFLSGEVLSCGIYASHFGLTDLENAEINIRITHNGKVLKHIRDNVSKVKNGDVTKIYSLDYRFDTVLSPQALVLSVSLEKDETLCKNSWELYLFPKAEKESTENLAVCEKVSENELVTLLEAGRDVVLFGTAPFNSLPTSFRPALAGRTSGNLATVISDHPALAQMPHEGFCSWQFEAMLEDGEAVVFEDDLIPFDPIVEIVSSHKNVIKQASLFEYKVLQGRLLVCSFKLDDTDPAAKWLRENLIKYAKSNKFNPTHTLTKEQLSTLINSKKIKLSENTNLAFNPNDTAGQTK